jgi:hypothetical protein
MSDKNGISSVFISSKNIDGKDLDQYILDTFFICDPKDLKIILYKGEILSRCFEEFESILQSQDKATGLFNNLKIIVIASSENQLNSGIMKNDKDQVIICNKEYNNEFETIKSVIDEKNKSTSVVVDCDKIEEVLGNLGNTAFSSIKESNN